MSEFNFNSDAEDDFPSGRYPEKPWTQRVFASGQYEGKTMKQVMETGSGRKWLRFMQSRPKNPKFAKMARDVDSALAYYEAARAKARPFDKPRESKAKRRHEARGQTIDDAEQEARDVLSNRPHGRITGPIDEVEARKILAAGQFAREILTDAVKRPNSPVKPNHADWDAAECLDSEPARRPQCSAPTTADCRTLDDAELEARDRQNPPVKPKKGDWIDDFVERTDVDISPHRRTRERSASPVRVPATSSRRSRTPEDKKYKFRSEV